MTTRKPVEMPEATSGSAALATLTQDAPSTTATIDPALLVVGANVRRDVDLDAAFVESIRERGVLAPILVTRDVLDQVLVLDGQRRTLAAIELGLASVPIAWIDGVGDDETRIVDQLVINDHRTGIRAADRAAGYEQLALMGRSAETIAKRTARPVEEVEAALAVAKSRVASEAAAAHPTMPLDVVAAVAEFDGDEDTVGKIVTAFESEGDASHQIAYAREKAADEALIAEAIARHAAQGVTAYRRPEYSQPSPYPDAARLHSLTDEPGADGYPPQITDEAHASCPHRGVELAVSYGRGLFEEEVCLDWKAAGHHKRDARNTAGATSGPKSEEEKAAARELRENRKKADVEKETRRNWWREFFQRRTIPAESALLAGQLLAAHNPYSADLEGTWDLFGGDRPSTWDKPAALKRIGTKRDAQAFLLAYGVAAFEETLGRDYFQDPKSVTALREYFDQMVAWGYVLGDVEKAAHKVAKRARR